MTTTEVSEPPYVQVARHAVKGPFSEPTRQSQLRCLAANAVFLIAYLNLVEVREVEIGGVKLGVSLGMIALLAFIYALYQLARFLGEATVEHALFKLEFAPIRDSAVASTHDERRGHEEWMAAMTQAQTAFAEKIDANRRFSTDRDERSAAIKARYAPRIAPLEECLRELGERVLATKDDLEAMRVHADQHSNAYEEWNALTTAQRAELDPIWAEPYPHQDMSEGSALIRNALGGYAMPTTERTVDALRLSQRRGLLNATLDMALPVGLTLFSAFVFVISRFDAGRAWLSVLSTG